MEFSVSWNQVAAFRLSRHQLLIRAPLEALVSVAGDMGGVQAQLFSAAQISLWSRVQDLQIAHIEDALDKRMLVKAACMRHTLFLVPADLLAVFAQGRTRRAEAEIRWALGKGVPKRVVDAVIDAALNVLDQPLTRPEIAERVSRMLGVQMQVIHGGGWGSRRKVAAVPVGELVYPVVDLLHLAAARGIICYGANRDNEPTFVRADAWIPNWKDIPGEQAEQLLLRMYLKAYGPATVKDYATWAGMTLTESRQIWAREQSGFVTVNVEGLVAEMLKEDLEVLLRAKFDPPLVRLLPYFDSFLLGHRDRNHLMPMEYQSKVYRPQGWIAPVVLVDGRVAAVWEYTRQGNRLIIKVEKFRKVSRSVISSIRAQAGDLARFLGSSFVDITFI